MPVLLLATLVHGLRPNSRVMMKLSGNKATNETLLLAEIVDLLGLIWWSKTKDGLKGYNRPKSVFSAIQGENETENVAFDSPEEFMRAREQIIGGK